MKGNFNRTTGYPSKIRFRLPEALSQGSGETHRDTLTVYYELFFRSKRTVLESIKQSLCRVHRARNEHEHKHYIRASIGAYRLIR